MIRRVLVAVVAGVLMTLVVQVGVSLVWRSSEDFEADWVRSTAVPERPDSIISISSVSGFGSTRMNAFESPKATFQSMSSDFWPPEVPALPVWLRDHLLVTGPAASVDWARSVVLRGWPMRSAWHLMVEQPEQDVGPVLGGISTRPWFGRTGSEMWAIDRVPVQMIWMGLVVNSMFYATVWMGAGFGVRRARAWWWMRSGRCSARGYASTGSVCPECGAGRKE